ncbi:hypothetical protein CBM2634_A200061 [Cupriavidus taiwanensis]|uniref:Uncharacterized protein n=1 Tax=Cupriavidus taiwanensis TaxID=164546 RepID=A0A375IZ94_9BURK|nr:hypothetical protein CBM2634_A200061 [Cupriavidus taiwanensis]
MQRIPEAFRRAGWKVRGRPFSYLSDVCKWGHGSGIP